MSDIKIEEAKAKVLENLDVFFADLRAKIEAVESYEMIEKQSSEVKKIADELLKDVTGGIMDMGIEYTPYTSGATPPASVPASNHNAWAHEQNALIMRQNCAQMAYNTRKFFTGKTSEIDNDYESRYWPVSTGK